MSSIYPSFEDRFKTGQNQPKIMLVNRYMVQSTVNPMKSFVYESINTLRMGETILINNEPHIVMSRA